MSRSILVHVTYITALVKISLSFSSCGCGNDSWISSLHSTIVLYWHFDNKLSSGWSCSSLFSRPSNICRPYHALSYKIRNFFAAYEIGAAFHPKHFGCKREHFILPVPWPCWVSISFYQAFLPCFKLYSDWWHWTPNRDSNIPLVMT